MPVTTRLYLAIRDPPACRASPAVLLAAPQPDRRHHRRPGRLRRDGQFQAAEPGETRRGPGAVTASASWATGRPPTPAQPVRGQGCPRKLRYTTVPGASLDTSVALATSGAVFAWGGNICGPDRRRHDDVAG